jgi:hypothetical protein
MAIPVIVLRLHRGACAGDRKAVLAIKIIKFSRKETLLSMIRMRGAPYSQFHRSKLLAALLRSTRKSQTAKSFKRTQVAKVRNQTVAALVQTEASTMAKRLLPRSEPKK